MSDTTKRPHRLERSTKHPKTNRLVFFFFPSVGSSMFVVRCSTFGSHPPVRGLNFEPRTMNYWHPPIRSSMLVVRHSCIDLRLTSAILNILNRRISNIEHRLYSGQITRKDSPHPKLRSYTNFAAHAFQHMLNNTKAKARSSLFA